MSGADDIPEIELRITSCRIEAPPTPPWWRPLKRFKAWRRKRRLSKWRVEIGELVDITDYDALAEELTKQMNTDLEETRT